MDSSIIYINSVLNFTNSLQLYDIFCNCLAPYHASVPYDVWQRQGYLMATEGNVVHYGFASLYLIMFLTNDRYTGIIFFGESHLL